MLLGAATGCDSPKAPQHPSASGLYTSSASHLHSISSNDFEKEIPFDSSEEINLKTFQPGDKFLEKICQGVIKAVDRKIPDMAKQIADCLNQPPVAENIKERKEIKIDEYFEAIDLDYVACKVCTKFCKEAPLKVRSHLRGNYGIFLKHTTSDSALNKERRKRLHEHVRGELHTWCESRNCQAIIEEQILKDKNIRAAQIIVSSAVQSLLELDGSLHFVRLNNMLETLLASQYPTKNDGREHFFSIRDIVFNKFSETLKDKLKSVENACFTLDKVTVRRQPFTVLMTYFFFEGKIHVLLNSVHKMKDSEYDGPGSAEMVGKVLMASLNLSKQEVAQKFRHATYDGVYATRDERVSGTVYNIKYCI